MNFTPYARVLFIHSHRKEALAAALILSRIGPQVQLTAKGWEGCHIALNSFFDLIIIDDGVGDIPVTELFFKLSFEKRRSTIILSNEEDWVKSPGTTFPGVLDILRKSVRPMDLVAAICENLINKFEKQHKEVPQLIIN